MFLGGIFATDPVITTAADGTVYVVGKDNWNSVWVGRYKAGSFLGWNFLGGIIQGKPSVTAGSDDAAYIAVRDDWNSAWMAVVESTGILRNWYYGGGIFGSDPQVAAPMDGSGTVRVTALDTFGSPWGGRFAESPTGWQGSWEFAGGMVQDLSLAADLGNEFFAGRDGANQLWWYNALSGEWSLVGFPGLAAGPLAAAPR